MGEFYTNKLVRYCEHKGLYWDDAVYRKVLPKLKQAKLTQKQFDVVMECHIDAVCEIVDPSQLTFIQRVGAALFYLRGKPLNRG